MTSRPRAFAIGWPVAHSRSPLLHGHWLKTYGLEGTYEAVPVREGEVGAFFDQIRAGEWRGGNVTLPHKHTALALADERDAAAGAIGAANTIVERDGRLLASNTDGRGFVSNLNAQSPGWRGSGGPAVILGAGGAARAILWALLAEGVERVRLVNRTREKAEMLAAPYGSRVEVVDWSGRAGALGDAILLANTTSLGMVAMPPLDIDLAGLPEAASVADVVYAPLETTLLASARARGNPAVDGLGMLLHQAVPGFEAWFGVRPKVTEELRALIVADLTAARH
jgi:shikimate dehydrogenase